MLGCHSAAQTRKGSFCLVFRLAMARQREEFHYLLQFGEVRVLMQLNACCSLNVGLRTVLPLVRCFKWCITKRGVAHGF